MLDPYSQLETARRDTSITHSEHSAGYPLSSFAKIADWYGFPLPSVNWNKSDWRDAVNEAAFAVRGPMPSLFKFLRAALKSHDTVLDVTVNTSAATYGTYALYLSSGNFTTCHVGRIVEITKADGTVLLFKSDPTQDISSHNTRLDLIKSPFGNAQYLGANFTDSSQAVTSGSYSVRFIPFLIHERSPGTTYKHVSDPLVLGDYYKPSVLGANAHEFDIGTWGGLHCVVEVELFPELFSVLPAYLLADNELSALSVGYGGKGYNDGVIVFKGGGGQGAHGTYTVDSSGTINSVTLVDKGAGYTSAPTPIVMHSKLASAQVVLPGSSYTTNTGGPDGKGSLTFTGGGGSGAVGEYTVNADGEITSATITAQGKNYTSIPKIGFSDPGGLGVNGFVTCNLEKTVDMGSGALRAVTISDGGGNYGNAQTYPLIFRGGGGSGAVGTVTSNSGGEIASISTSALGTSYRTAPEVYVGSYDKSISSTIAISDGGRWLDAPTISVTGTGVGNSYSVLLDRFLIKNGGSGYEPNSELKLKFTGGDHTVSITGIAPQNLDDFMGHTGSLSGEANYQGTVALVTTSAAHQLTVGQTVRIVVNDPNSGNAGTVSYSGSLDTVEMRVLPGDGLRISYQEALTFSASTSGTNTTTLNIGHDGPVHFWLRKPLKEGTVKVTINGTVLEKSTDDGEVYSTSSGQSESFTLAPGLNPQSLSSTKHFTHITSVVIVQTSADLSGVGTDYNFQPKISGTLFNAVKSGSNNPSANLGTVSATLTAINALTGFTATLTGDSKEAGSIQELDGLALQSIKSTTVTITNKKSSTKKAKYTSGVNYTVMRLTDNTSQFYIFKPSWQSQGTPFSSAVTYTGSVSTVWKKPTVYAHTDSLGRLVRLDVQGHGHGYVKAPTVTLESEDVIQDPLNQSPPKTVTSEAVPQNHILTQVSAAPKEPLEPQFDIVDELAEAGLTYKDNEFLKTGLGKKENRVKIFLDRQGQATIQAGQLAWIKNVSRYDAAKKTFKRHPVSYPFFKFVSTGQKVPNKFSDTSEALYPPVGTEVRISQNPSQDIKNLTGRTGTVEAFATVAGDEDYKYLTLIETEFGDQITSHEFFDGGTASVSVSWRHPDTFGIGDLKSIEQYESPHGLVDNCLSFVHNPDYHKLASVSGCFATFELPYDNSAGETMVFEGTTAWGMAPALATIYTEGRACEILAEPQGRVSWAGGGEKAGISRSLLTDPTLSVRLSSDIHLPEAGGWAYITGHSVSGLNGRVYVLPTSRRDTVRLRDFNKDSLSITTEGTGGYFYAPGGHGLKAHYKISDDGKGQISSSSKWVLEKNGGTFRTAPYLFPEKPSEPRDDYRGPSMGWPTGVTTLADGLAHTYATVGYSHITGGLAFTSDASATTARGGDLLFHGGGGKPVEIEEVVAGGGWIAGIKTQSAHGLSTNDYVRIRNVRDANGEPVDIINRKVKVTVVSATAFMVFDATLGTNTFIATDLSTDDFVGGAVDLVAEQATGTFTIGDDGSVSGATVTTAGGYYSFPPEITVPKNSIAYKSTLYKLSADENVVDDAMFGSANAPLAPPHLTSTLLYDATIAATVEKAAFSVTLAANAAENTNTSDSSTIHVTETSQKDVSVSLSWNDGEVTHFWGAKVPGGWQVTGTPSITNAGSNYVSENNFGGFQGFLKVEGGGNQVIEHAKIMFRISSGTIAELAVVHPGLGYTSAPTLSMPDGSEGAGATFSASIQSNTMANMAEKIADTINNGCLYPVLALTEDKEQEGFVWHNGANPPSFNGIGFSATDSVSGSSGFGEVLVKVTPSGPTVPNEAKMSVLGPGGALAKNFAVGDSSTGFVGLGHYGQCIITQPNWSLVSQGTDTSLSKVIFDRTHADGLTESHTLYLTGGGGSPVEAESPTRPAGMEFSAHLREGVIRTNSVTGEVEELLGHADVPNSGTPSTKYAYPIYLQSAYDRSLMDYLSALVPAGIQVVVTHRDCDSDSYISPADVVDALSLAPTAHGNPFVTKKGPQLVTEPFHAGAKSGQASQEDHSDEKDDENLNPDVPPPWSGPTPGGPGI